MENWPKKVRTWDVRSLSTQNKCVRLFAQKNKRKILHSDTVRYFPLCTDFKKNAYTEIAIIKKGVDT